MGRMRSALRAYALESPDTAVVLRKLDQKMQYFEGDVMATVSYAVLDPGSGQLRISSAGHFPPVVAAPGRRGALAEIAVDAPIGVADAPRRQVTTLALAPGAVLCFFTDGLVERRNKALDDGITLLCRDRVTRAAGECLPVGDESPGRKRAPRRRHRPSRPALATRSAVVIWSAWLPMQMVAALRSGAWARVRAQTTCRRPFLCSSGPGLGSRGDLNLRPLGYEPYARLPRLPHSGASADQANALTSVAGVSPRLPRPDQSR